MGRSRKYLQLEVYPHCDFCQDAVKNIQSAITRMKDGQQIIIKINKDGYMTHVDSDYQIIQYRPGGPLNK